MLPSGRAGDDDDAHAGHDGAGRIGAVRRRRNQHDVALRVAAVAVIGANHHQAGELALRAGVRLQRHGGEAGDLARAPLRARGRSADSPAACSTGANGCSCENSGQVIGSISDAAFSFIVQEPSGIIDVSRPMSLRSSAADVAHHLGLGVVRVEHRMRQERRRPRQRRPDTSAATSGSPDWSAAPAVARRRRANTVDDRRDVVGVGRLVERDVDRCRRRGSGSSCRAASAALAHARRRSAHARGAACRSSRSFSCATPSAASSRSSSARQARARGARCAVSPSGRGRPRRSRPCWPAAPAPCRCSTSPSRAGCAARASAAPCGTRGSPCASTDTPMMRPGACRTCFSSVAKNAACGPP